MLLAEGKLGELIKNEPVFGYKGTSRNGAIRLKDLGLTKHDSS